jgi:hypothetical protein
LINIPAYLEDNDFEVIAKPLKRLEFKSLSLIKPDTKNFKFSRDKANER